MRRPRWLFATALVLAAIAAPRVVLATVEATRGDTEVYLDGDDDNSRGAPTQALGPGYALTIGESVLLPHYRVLVTTPALAGPALAAIDEVNAALGARLELAGAAPAAGTSTHQGTIVLRTSPHLGCVPRAAGCAQTWFEKEPGRHDWVVARTEIAFRSDLVATAEAAGSAHTRAVLLHELGHALGLAHYSGEFMGRLQAMAPSATTSAQAHLGAGDVAGLRAMAYHSRLDGR